MWKFLTPWKKEPIAKPDDRIMMIAQLNARVQPLDRGAIFEDPLDEVLRSCGIGEVTGGGTMMAAEPDGIKYCDLEIMTNDASQSTIQKIIESLEALGAPKGSILKISPDDQEIAFGRSEGMAVFLNGTDLPLATYENGDVNKVIADIDLQLSGEGSLLGHWEGSHETALYFYGRSFEVMRAKTASYLEGEPLCDKARVVQIA